MPLILVWHYTQPSPEVVVCFLLSLYPSPEPATAHGILVSALATAWPTLILWTSLALVLPEGGWWIFFRWFSPWQYPTQYFDPQDVRYWHLDWIGLPCLVLHDGVNYAPTPGYSPHAKWHVRLRVSLRRERRIRLDKAHSRNLKFRELEESYHSLWHLRERRAKRKQQKSLVSGLATQPPETPDPTRGKSGLQIYNELTRVRQTPRLKLGQEFQYEKEHVEALLNMIQPLIGTNISSCLTHHWLPLDLNQ